MSIPPAWLNKTLADLLRAARSEPTGIAFEALRHPQTNERCVIVLCVSLQELVERVEEVFSLAEDGITEPWDSFTLGEALRRTLVVGTMCFERFGSRKERNSALVLIAADPLSVKRLESLFKMAS